MVEFGGDWCTAKIHSFDADNYDYIIATTEIWRNVWRDVSLTVLPLQLARVKMLLLPRPRILKPHLRHSLAEPGYVRYPLKVLTVGIAVQLKIRLENG